MMDSVSIKDKILFEEIPDGEQYRRNRQTLWGRGGDGC
jgi:hypothetical protein